ncbi:DedA family protein [Prosthecobacter sp. SYSU 5D2]|uniref:DedA family protein n=1 Tax=Prosthecobacter sp. SYSU 5D2 TaxID=3134134 RepID=UPI0031FF3078
MIGDFLDLILHVDKHLLTFAQNYGTLIYVLLFAIVFCETGLVVTPFLPGDSLLFAVGALSVQGFVRLEYIIPLLIVAAIIGDNLNYWIGRKAGSWMVTQRWFKRDYLSKTESFFVKHGGKAIILARFVPIVRTFAPFTAGFGQMHYTRFLGYSLGGGFIWVISFTLAGYFLGSIPFIKNNLKLVFVLIIFVSVLPIVIEVIKHKLAALKQSGE